MDNNFKDATKIIIILILFAVVLQLYKNIFDGNETLNKLENYRVAKLPESIACIFNKNDCEDQAINGWSIVRGMMYFLIGLLIPGHYLAILIISILIEVGKPYFGGKPKYIINPLTNLVGYSLGSFIRRSW